MGRITNTGQTPAKQRRAHIRSCAEALRLLAQHESLASGRFDAEAKDLAAFLVLHLRGIYDTIDESAHAWDDRNYWKKAEALREKWRWSRTAARTLAALVLADHWAEVPPVLVSLVPHFADVTIHQLTRDADWWCGALRALKRQAAAPTR
ncbi:MAG: hypothetical protein AAGI91_13735 [Bacteroidota bacterium]